MDAELDTLCCAQAIMGIPSDRRFLAVARKRLVNLFPELPSQAGYWKRRRRLADGIEWLMGVFTCRSPGFRDDLLLCDSTPVPCGARRETAKRSALGEVETHSCARRFCDCARVIPAIRWVGAFIPIHGANDVAYGVPSRTRSPW